MSSHVTLNNVKQKFSPQCVTKKCDFFVKIFFALFFVLLVITQGRAYEVSVGVLDVLENDPRQNDQKFWSFRSNSSTATPVNLIPVVERIRWWNPLDMTRGMCSLLKNGIENIVSLAPTKYQPLLTSYANYYKLPLITSSSSENSAPDKFAISLVPDSAEAISQLLLFYNWNSFFFFYDQDDGPTKLQIILQKTNLKAEVEGLWRVLNGEEAQRYMQILQQDSDGIPLRILLSVRESVLDEIIATISAGNVMNKNIHFILMDPVAYIKDDEKYGYYGSHLVTKISLTNSKSLEFRELENRWLTLAASQWPVSNLKYVPDSAITMHDAADLLQQTYTRLFQERRGFAERNRTTSGLNCLKDGPKYVDDGIVTAEYIRKTVFDSDTTGKVKFDENGRRILYSFDITEISPALNKKIGIWSSQTGLKIVQNRLKPEQKDESSTAKSENFSEMNPAVRVTTILNKPYVILKSDAGIRKGNDKYEGYVIDLLSKVSETLGWTYEIHEVKDKRYGSPDIKQPNGMIGELIKEEADIAAADLTVTPAREKVVDFSKPFFQTGLNILMKKPEAQESTPGFSVLTFLNVWSYKVWLLLACAYLIAGGSSFAASYFTGYPDRIRSLDTKGSDKLSLCSSFWFTLGGLVLRDTGIYPRSISHRILTTVWWIFSLLLLVCYISSLSFALIKTRSSVQSTILKRTSHEVLKSFVEKGYPKVFVLKSGSTYSFFKNSEMGLFKDYGRYITENPSDLVSSYIEGVQKVRQSGGSFAMIMESPASQFYRSHEPCDTIVTAEFLDTKKIGFAFQKGSRLKDSVDHVLLDMMENGELRRLYEKWWHLQSECEDPYLNILQEVYSDSLTLNNVSGVFYFLIICVVIALAAAIAEYFFQSRKLSVGS